MLTTVAEIRDHIGSEADWYNQIVVTSATAFSPDDNEVTCIEHADRLQFEGFVIHPRKLRSEPFELLVDNDEDAHYILDIIEQSHIALARRQGMALHLVSESRHSSQLGSWVKAEV